MLDFNEIPRKDRVIVAMDCDVVEARNLGNSLADAASWVKIGMTLYYAVGPGIVAEMKERGFKVFLDLKFFDIPHQVEGAAYSAAMSGADMLTMHTMGGIDMMRAAQRGVQRAAEKTGGDVPITLGITVLTSMNDETLAQMGVANPMRDQVKMLAGLTQEAGISGVVCSAQESTMLREVLGPQAYIVTPGIRPKGAEIGDQSRVTTPAEAFANGSSHIVVGRPITQASDPREAFLKIAEELA